MKYKTKNILRAMAQYLGLTIRFVDYLGDETHGKLLPREKRILINANKPRFEHVFTLLHEFGHYSIHFKQVAPKMYDRWYLNRRWSIQAVLKFAQRLKRTIRYQIYKRGGDEWEADLWAMCAFVYLNKKTSRADLDAWLKQHPEKRSDYRLVLIATVFCDTKKRVTNAWKWLNASAEI